MAEKKTNKSGIELLDAVPETIIDWEKDSGKDVAVLLVPRFRKGPLKKWLQPRLKRPFMRISLDDVGTFVWENIDGKKTGREICALMKEHFGEKVEPVEDRLKLFFTTMFSSNFIRYWQRT